MASDPEGIQLEKKKFGNRNPYLSHTASWVYYAMQITISITVLEYQDKKLSIVVNDLLNNLSSHRDLVDW